MDKSRNVFRPLSEEAEMSSSQKAVELTSMSIRVENGESKKLTLQASDQGGFYRLDIHVEANGVLELNGIGSLGKGALLEVQVYIACKGQVIINRTLDVIGEGAECYFKTLGKIAGNGKVAIADRLENIASTATCSIASRLVFKENASGDIRALVHVAKGTKEVRVREDFRSLILGKNNRVRCIPELKVATKNCTATHAASIAYPDKKELQYLMSRGLRSDEAQECLAEAFMKTV